ncbi:hypothetical protein [Proteiniclasticum ruminis]|nr:hypothetical protein [Proteiniclasticum ruminis]
MSAKKKFTVEEAREYGERLGIDWKRFDVEAWMWSWNMAEQMISPM